ncbi:MAG TPA: hypothetical protein DDW94_08560 [Deltaproteobacteria bacterium]|nr:MAG: hypothetical protein A2Z79_03075 [Deltaproteobacteria bacterium GWA2_55_82]OGQ62266.1 MAG: hypothetical protein A3I81_04985 [Deltaproteobacteria bacterium RIFCSPLOWO2_02_FULL_55_12]OIJ74377.1 MAG: hypothetical protein A2V21_308975 [Deltaproteobacteria bacterium GWC2_55_46]HBG47025.1 hypothetical protein [Deltaproteobacteria bacterium]HCY10915.1 hypothetical protein [Deltaproteobacteria bacterium]
MRGAQTVDRSDIVPRSPVVPHLDSVSNGGFYFLVEYILIATAFFVKWEVGEDEAMCGLGTEKAGARLTLLFS